MEPVKVITLPIKFIRSKNYHLVLKDSEGIFFYFNEDGSCDGMSQVLLIPIDDMPN